MTQHPTPGQIFFTLLAANMIALGLLAFAAYLVYLDRGGWGWCVAGAIYCGKTLSKSEGTKSDAA